MVFIFICVSYFKYFREIFVLFLYLVSEEILGEEVV